jgi:hypothetical protein
MSLVLSPNSRARSLGPRQRFAIGFLTHIGGQHFFRRFRDLALGADGKFQRPRKALALPITGRKALAIPGGEGN